MGRAIDAEKTMNKLLYGDAYISEELAEYIKQVFGEQPTIEAKAVKHGKWEFGRQNGAAGQWCTNCKSGFAGENAEWIAKEHDFCPKCGARMDGE